MILNSSNVKISIKQRSAFFFMRRYSLEVVSRGSCCLVTTLAHLIHMIKVIESLFIFLISHNKLWTIKKVAFIDIYWPQI